MKTIRVTAAVIRKGDRVFATARGYGDYKGGWEFPGGKIEPGETPREALAREIREELDREISSKRSNMITPLFICLWIASGAVSGAEASLSERRRRQGG